MAKKQTLNAMRPPLFLCPVLALVLSCSPPAQKLGVTITGRTMGTSFSVKIADRELPEGVDALALESGIDQVLAAVNLQMSTYMPESEISAFNQSRDSSWFPVSPDFARVTKRALQLSEASDGAFDVTVGPLVNLWGFGPDEPRTTLPDAREIERLKGEVGYHNLQVSLQPPALKKSIPGLYCDLSAIAKGFGVDKVAEYLETKGVRNYMVEIGGEVRTRGLSSQGGPWRIGVELPDQNSGIHSVLLISNRAVATSGDYFNYFEVDGVRYSHTIDPVTGWPVKHNLASVTVIHDSCMVADGLATAIDVMGPERGFQFALARNLAVYFLLREQPGFSVKMTPAFEQYLERHN